MAAGLLTDLRAGGRPGDEVVAAWPEADDDALAGVLDVLLDYPALLGPFVHKPDKDETADALLENAAAFLMTDQPYPWPTARRHRWTMWAGLAVAAGVATLPLIESNASERTFWTAASVLTIAAAGVIVVAVARRLRQPDPRKQRFWPFREADASAYNARDLWAADPQQSAGKRQDTIG